MECRRHGVQRRKLRHLRRPGARRAAAGAGGGRAHPRRGDRHRLECPQRRPAGRACDRRRHRARPAAGSARSVPAMRTADRLSPGRRRGSAVQRGPVRQGHLDVRRDVRVRPRARRARAWPRLPQGRTALPGDLDARRRRRPLLRGARAAQQGAAAGRLSPAVGRSGLPPDAVGAGLRARLRARRQQLLLRRRRRHLELVPAGLRPDAHPARQPRRCRPACLEEGARCLSRPLQGRGRASCPPGVPRHHRPPTLSLCWGARRLLRAPQQINPPARSRSAGSSVPGPPACAPA